jgi:K+-sensing histidine kinase KdpD
MDGARAEIHRKPSSLADILETAAQRIRPLLDPPARMVVRQDRDVDDLVNTDGTLLAEAIFYVGRHLALGLAGRTCELRAVRLPVGNVEHIVIDLAAADDVDAPANAVAIFDAQTLERPATNTSVGGYGLSLAVAHRICVLLGGSLLSSARTDDSPRFRILVPNLKD